MPKKNKKINAWKLVSIVFIVVFALILMGALLRNLRFKSSITMPSNFQENMAKSVASTDLLARGENVSMFEISVSGGIKPFSLTKPIRNITEVSIYNDTIMHQYIIDANTGEILMYTKSESYGYINYSDNKHSAPPNPPWMLPLIGRPGR